jgi:hypothetical protein
MAHILIFLIISILSSFGIAIALVEKGDEFPIKRYKLLLRKFIHDKMHWKFSHVLDCTVCSSFWIALFVDTFLFIFTGGAYFLWPLSGFAVLGFTWFIIQLLNVLDHPCE